MLAELAGALAAGLDGPHARPLVGVALDFWTWQRLAGEGLDDDEAAALMARVAVGPGSDMRASG
jgi:hypothetical protein